MVKHSYKLPSYHKNDQKLSKCFVKIEKLSTEQLLRLTSKKETGNAVFKQKLQTETVKNKDNKLVASSFVKLEKLSPETITKWSKSNKENIADQTEVKYKLKLPKTPARKNAASTKINSIKLPPPPLNQVGLPNTQTETIPSTSAVQDVGSQLDKKWTLNDFSIGKPVGKGRFGVCYLAREKRSDLQLICVLKIMKKELLVKNKTKDNLKAEYDIQIQLRHPNILRMFGFFENQSYVHLILEYAPNGNLYKKILSHKNLNTKIDNALSAKYIYQTTKALIYLHSKNIIHRDLKPENLILGVYDEIKLCDFGWSKVHDPAKPETCLAGTVNYLCPEMIFGEPHSTTVDNWCLGVLCYELCVGLAPFEDQNNRKILDRIKNLDYCRERIENKYARSLIDKLLKLVPSERLELTSVLTDYWIINYADRDNTYEKHFNV